MNRERCVAKALEELVIEELDVLYQGALFLSAGDPHRADALLRDTAVAAYRAGARQGRLVGPRPLESLMVRRFREMHGPSERESAAARRDRPPLAWRGSLEPDALFRAAGAVPPEPRTALWLVLIRRWSYDDAARLLQVDSHGLKGLLAYRDAFMSAAVGASPRTRAAE